MIEPELLDLHRQTVTIRRKTAVDNFGNATYGSGTTYKARVVNQIQSVKNANGEDAQSMTTIYFTDYVAIDLDDEITLPSPFTERNAPPIINYRHFPDLETDSIHHTEVYL